MNIVLYTTGCPKCHVLETKLKQKNISYTEVNDVKIMQDKGFEFVPVLEVDGTAYNFKDASDWIKEQ